MVIKKRGSLNGNIQFLISGDPLYERVLPRFQHWRSERPYFTWSYNGKNFTVSRRKIRFEDTVLVLTIDEVS